MSALIENARGGVQQVAALLWDATAEGDLVAAAAQALISGRVLFLIADHPNAWLAAVIAAALRRDALDPAWPPVFAVTPDTRLLTLLGRDYGADHPLRLQCEILIRQGDVALLLPCAEPSSELFDAAGIAATRGATLATLGPELPAVGAELTLVLPAAQRAGLHGAQLALGHAFAEALAAALPAAPPADLEPALEAFRCRNCAHPLAVPRHLAGRLGTCPTCHNNTVLGAAAALPDGDPRSRMRFTLRDCQLRLAIAPPAEPSTPIAAQITLENLSRSGLLAALADASAEIAVGDPLSIQLATPAFEEPLGILGAATRVTREGPIQHVGITFVSLEPTVAERLRALEQNIVLRNIAHPLPGDDE